MLSLETHRPMQVEYPSSCPRLHASVIAVSFGQWIWFRVLQLLPAAVAAISTLAVPVIGVFAGALLLGETVTIFELGALVLVSIALAIVLVGHAGWRRLVGKN